MNDRSLGRLQRVDLRTIWTSEPVQFTPWLARPENLEILGETLGLDFESESVEVEKEVGSFRADIVCKDSEGSSVLIENQLEQTDHNHFGKLLTYAAGRQAVTVVWLAARFRDEHRAALDWLNEITHEKSRFFGLEIELWQIGDSPAAPKFNIVSMPNDWSRLVAQSSRAMDDAELTKTKLKQMEYWTRLQSVLDDQNGEVKGNRKPQPQHWMEYPIGRTGFWLSAVLHSRQKYIRVELYISGVDAANHLDRLEQQRDEIERELDYRLEWGDQSPTARDRRIAYYRRDVDSDDESDWPRQHEWLAKHLNDLHRVFVQRVRDL